MDEFELWANLAEYAREDAYWGLLREARKARSEQVAGDPYALAHWGWRRRLSLILGRLVPSAAGRSGDAAAR